MVSNRVSLRKIITDVLRCAIVTLRLVSAQSEMEGFIVGGALASINRNPHSAFISISCKTETFTHVSWICGASILNQEILMTAAHCIYCLEAWNIAAYVGHERKHKGIASTARSYTIHRRHEPTETLYDIGLVRLNTRLNFSQKVKRISILKNPPFSETAQVAGWGLVDEVNKKTSDKLRYITQNMMKNKDCAKIMGNLGPGTFCASNDRKNDTVSMGDSGSALVIRNFIQIGIVSYKIPRISSQIIVYTDVAFFYEWIREHSKRLYCSA